MHGGGENVGYWFGIASNREGKEYGPTSTFTVNMLDNLIATGYCDPVIVVLSSFCSDVEGYEDAQVDLTSNYYQELRNEIIPLVESTYSTYAEDTTNEGLIASRDYVLMQVCPWVP